MRLKHIIYNEDFAKFLLRVGIASLMLMHGICKIKTGVNDIEQWLSEIGVPGFVSYGVYIPEIVAPIFLIAGVFVRSAGFLLLMNMCVALFYLYTKGYAPFSVDAYGGFHAEIDILYMLIFCALIFLGGGKYTLFNISKKPSYIIDSKNS